MIATVLLCLISTLVFCLCTRGALAYGVAANRPSRGRLHGSAFSARARRMAQGYFTMALVVLAAMAFAGMIKSYIELFTQL